MAYVDFEDEPSASKALIQTDGMLIGENQISVAISNPPKRKQQQDEMAPSDKSIEIKRSLGSGSVGSRSEPVNKPVRPAATVSSFVPRSQQLMGRKRL